MCGIVGIRRFDGAPIEPALVRRMTEQLTHRGPDDTGEWHGPAVAFGHRRLSIIDPEGSPQPMSRGPLHVCFNGEIFDYAARRAELVDAGFDFETRGDTEVLLASFQKQRQQSVEALDGQFAYAIYDDTSAELWLFRDRMGVIPLYYYADSEMFAFASEVKALLPALGRPEVDLDSAREYLGFRSVPAPHTLFKGIRKLRAGHRLRVDRRGDIATDPYWQIPAQEPDSDISDADALARLDAALEAAVDSRLVADVPVGAFLSGGLDSSLIVSLMAKRREEQGGSPVATYVAGFDDPGLDERGPAALVAQAFGTDHHEVVVAPDDFVDLIPKLTWHRDAPISEPSDVALFRLAERASQDVKVLLSGEGADELFAGYPKYRFATRAALADWLPAALRAPLVGGAAGLLPESLWRPRIALRAMAARSEAERMRTWFSPFTQGERDALIARPDRPGYAELAARARGDLLQRMLYVDCHVWLSDNLLERGDRMAMAASVESRPPFMDHRLVELAFSLPSRMKLRAGTTKWAIRQLAEQRLPREIIARPKLGFRVPMRAWLREGRMADLAADLLLSRDSITREIFRAAEIDRLIDTHRSGRRNEDIRIWTLLGFEIWHRRFIQGDA